MKYKSNYIEKLNILPQELQDRILNIVFREHKLFLKKIDYSYYCCIIFSPSTLLLLEF